MEDNYCLLLADKLSRRPHILATSCGVLNLPCMQLQDLAWHSMLSKAAQQTHRRGRFKLTKSTFYVVLIRTQIIGE